MQIGDYLEALGEHGPALADTAAQAGLDAPVPTCPDWQVRDLVGHVGAVHRWATAYLQAGADSGRIPFPDPPARGLLDWYRDGLGALIETLVVAPDDLPAWTFFAAPNPKAFWARRQAHETAIHHTDAAAAAGTMLQYPIEFAVDGIDELLNGFLSRSRPALLADPACTLLIAPTDAGAWWHMTIGPDGRATRSDGDQGADTTLRGRAGDLYLYLWNRPPQDPIQIDGDQRVAQLWREQARI